MASESLGTMVVGVTADISPAERALTSMANMLERFERQQTNRARSASTRQKQFGGLPEYGPYTEEQMFAEMLRKEQVQQQAISRWVQRDIQSSEKAAVQSRGIEPHMAGLADEFRQRQQSEINALQVEGEKLMQAEKKKTDKLIAEGERLNSNMANLAVEFRQRQQREIDDLHAKAEKWLRIESKKNEAIIAEGERLNANMRNLAVEFRQRQQQEIDALQAVAEKEMRIEKRRTDERIANGERLNANMANLAMEFRQKQEREEQLAMQAGQALDDNMKELGRKFRAGMFNDGAGGVAHSAEKVRFAVLNLGYGIQDIAQVMGTGGFPAAIRASANNMTGLAVLFDKTAYASGGLKAALMTPEVAMIGIATVTMLAADALDKYQKRLQQAAAESAKAKFARFDIAEIGTTAERRSRFREELAETKSSSDTKRILEQKQRDDRVAADRELQEKTTAQQIRDELEKNKKIMALRKQLLDAGVSQPLNAAGMGPAAQAYAKEQQQALTIDERQLQADITEGTRKLKEAEDAVNKTIGDRIELLKEMDKAQEDAASKRRKENEEWKVDELNRQRDLFAEQEREAMRAHQGDIEYRLQFLGRRRREITEQNRKAMSPVGAAGFESAEAYESLARSRMRGDPQTDLLQKIAREEEKATKALEDIRERLDPGRRARIAVLEALD